MTYGSNRFSSGFQAGDRKSVLISRFARLKSLYRVPAAVLLEVVGVG